QVFLDAERREQPSAFRHQRDAASDHLESGRLSRRYSGEDDVATAWRQLPSDAFEQRAFAGAIGADHRHDLTRLDMQRDAEQRLEIAIEDVEVAGVEER